MEKVKLNIEGMTCKNCQGKVEKALNELVGVENVKINLKKKIAKVKYDETINKTEDLTNAVSEAGYPAEVI